MTIDSGAVARAARRGLRSAQASYQELSGRWQPPEHMAAVYIAEHVARLRAVAAVTLEENVHEVLVQAGLRRGPLPKVLPRKGRFDVVVWNERWPKGVVEVKSVWDAKLNRDIERVCWAIDVTRRLSWGLVASVHAKADGSWKPGRERIAERSERVFKEAEATAEPFGLRLERHPTLYYETDDGAWMADVIHIRRQ